jgi:DNA-binding XRE family transcriptional regulator
MTGIHIEKEIGEGNETVYVYHFPSQRQKITGAYPIKIGRAGIDPVIRVKSQQASMAEKPVIDLIIRCPDSSYLESHIHSRLKHKSLNYFGSEWFNCTPEEVEDIYNVSAYNTKNMTIGEQLRHFRKIKDLTQQELSTLSGVSQSSISDIEKGIVDVRVDTVIRLCNYLGLRLSLEVNT